MAPVIVVVEYVLILECESTCSTVPVKTAAQAGFDDLAKVAAKPRAESAATNAVFAPPARKRITIAV
jgi:hypothetical protein